jgi:hypothetical protein
MHKAKQQTAPKDKISQRIGYLFAQGTAPGRTWVFLLESSGLRHKVRHNFWILCGQKLKAFRGALDGRGAEPEAPAPPADTFPVLRKYIRKMRTSPILTRLFPAVGQGILAATLLSAERSF